MDLIDQFRYLVGGYYGILLMDNYPLKEYILKDIEEYIKDFVKENNIEKSICLNNQIDVKEHVTNKVKLQDALLVLNLIKGPIDLVLLIKEELKKYSKK